MGFEILKNRVNDTRRRHIKKYEPPSTIHHGSTMLSNRLFGRRQRAYVAKKKIDNEETIAEYIETRWQVKRIVKQKKWNRKWSIARIGNQSKSFYSYFNERRIVWDNIGPLKTLDGIVITTDNDMANIMNNYFSSMFTIEQLTNVPQLGRYEGNIIDTFKYSTEEVLQKLHRLNILYTSPQDQIFFTLGLTGH